MEGVYSTISRAKQHHKYLDKKVSKIDTISTLTQQAIELLTEYRSSLISAAVTGKLNIDEVTHVE